MWTPLSETKPESPTASSHLELDDSAQRMRMNQVFNTALVSSHAETRPETAEEIQGLMKTSAFGAILQSVQLLAGDQGISEVEAAREIIATFRQMDRLWTEYLVSEGAECLKKSI